MQVALQFMESNHSVHQVITRKPISVYAVSKISMELLSNVYFNLYNLNSVGLRFFTVYGHGKTGWLTSNFAN